MAKKTYYMVCQTADDVIIYTNEQNVIPSPGAGLEVRSATFDVTDTGDTPDVLTPLGMPVEGGTFVAPSTYTPPQELVLKCSWSGDGVLSGDGLRYELTPDGIDQAVLSLQKHDAISMADVNSGSEVYWLLFYGPDANPDVGKVTLVNGAGSITFTPASGVKGLVKIELVPEVDSSPEMCDPVASLALN